MMVSALNCACQGGWTALMWASYKGRTEVAKLLLEKGANPNITGMVSVCFKNHLFSVPQQDV